MTTADRLADELWVCHLGTVPYRDALAMQERHPRAPPGRRAARHAAAARAPARLHARAALAAPSELPLGEDFYRAQGHRGRRRPTAAGASPTTAPASSSAIRSCASTTSARTCARWRRRSSPRSPRRASRRALAPRGGPDYTGVWVQERKIASIGVHVSRGVTTHGFAVNVDNDLEPFSWVVACGLPDVQMTSLARELGAAARAGPGLLAQGAWPTSFCEAHGRRQRLVSPRASGSTRRTPRARAERARSDRSPAAGEAVPA